MIKFYKILFMNSLILGTLISISSCSWMTMWLGLEINLLSIIPLINSTKNSYSTEASIKYFLTQALASLILLFSITSLLLINEFISPRMDQIMLIVMNSSLLTKIGAAPFHFWFPEVMEGLNWNNCLILLTWQKIAPMILILNNKPNNMFLATIILMSIFISGIMAINQISLRKIMALSSINHMGWMISAVFSAQSLWITYFVIYSIITFNIVMIFKYTASLFLTQMMNSLNQNKLVKLSIMLNFLSLGGLPPFLGFLPKWLMVQTLTNNNMLLLSATMIILTLISLYIYVRILFSSLILLTSETKIVHKLNNSYMIIFINMTTSVSIIFSTYILTSM